jgi:hypothetical protein
MNEGTNETRGPGALDQEIDRIDRGGDAWLEGDEAVAVEVRRPLDKVIPVRLPADKWEALRAEARELGIAPSTLLRMWVFEKLRQVQRATSVA